MAAGLTAAAAEFGKDGVADLGSYSYAAGVEIHPFKSLALTDRQCLTTAREGALPIAVTGLPHRLIGRYRNVRSRPEGYRRPCIEARLPILVRLDDSFALLGLDGGRQNPLPS